MLCKQTNFLTDTYYIHPVELVLKVFYVMKEKILFFSHESKLYGAPRSMLILAEALKEKYKVKIFTYGEGDLVNAAVAREIPIKVIKKPFAHLCGKKGLLARVINKFASFLSLFFCLFLVKKEKPSIVYVNTVANYYPVLFAKLLGIKTIVHVRESENYIFPETKRKKFCVDIIFKNSRNFICVSDSVSALVEKKLIDVGNKQGAVVTIYNGIDCNEFSCAPRDALPLVLPKNKKVVGYLGNLVPRKGLAFFLKAAESVLKKRDDVVFVAVGGDAEGFEKLIEELSISQSSKSSILHIPFIKKPQAAFDKFDIFCMTSLAEAFGRVNIEAACMKVPVIATAVGGNKEVFQEDGTAEFVSPGEPDELAAKISYLLDNEDISEQLAINAYQRVQRVFTIERYITGCESVIESVLKQQ